MRSLFLLLLLGMCGGLPLAAQVHLSEAFTDLLDAADLAFVEPLEARYRDVRVPAGDFQDYSFAIRSRKEKLEIRYLVYPFREHDRLARAPQVRAMRLLLHLATNQQDKVMRGMEVKPEDLQQGFQADWGKTFFFTPKASFSSRQHCKMLAIHGEGKGTAFVFFLFDEPGPALDHRFYALHFREGPDATQ